MRIIEITEIEQLIYSYLDYCEDLNMLKQINKNYRDIINNNDIYKIIYTVINNKIDHIDNKIEHVHDKFIEACKKDLFAVKYLFYKYSCVSHGYVFRFSCCNGCLDVAQWLWQLDNKIDLYVLGVHLFHHACKDRHLNITR